jgi:chaperone modulatory protein CbpM
VKLELTEAVWLDENGEVTLVELAECSGLSEPELRELIEVGALEPLDPTASAWRFHGHSVSAARCARRLRDDFELDAPALALVLSLLDRMRELQLEVEHAQARLAASLIR